ncbi:hypothetical protein LAZ67_17001982 [Cordylochernes scorpioides]|uniref:RNA-directed DNA polymerase n=1 Tax=Cordylochernes scorpioides TaxID=51811 RepID=A0ABY6LDU1_9ARAC|nr:hypothetical protein LAZ67_17001982 [Cordylochernes scorpioides]
MERDKKLRSVTRTRFTKVVNILDPEIRKTDADVGVVKDQFSKLKDIDCKLKDLDQKMLDHMMLADAEEDTLNCEIEEAEHYSDTFITLERRVRELIDSDNKIDVKSLGSSNGSSMAKSYKLPKFEIRKFDGELINWLPFWAQFEKIHEDTELHDADKFHYLVQSMQSNTRARELIESYPQTAENYAKAVQALKQRTPPDERRSVAKLYDKLETQLRSLESLGVDTKENTAWLFPMIESCLPEDVLVAWQRSPLNNCDASKNFNSNSSSRLNNLLDFLRREVEGEERRLLARRGFEGFSPKEKLRNKFKQNSNIPTAAGLFSAKEMGCLFCENNHQSKDCITAQSMPFKDKRAKIYEKRCCLKCLKPGHLAKACKRAVQCNICAKGHYVLLCPDLPCNRKEKTHVSEVVQSALANQQCTRDVTLMTLMVNIMENNGYRRVRALLDPGSQKSYILESTALEVKLKPVGNVNIAHSLFGGTQTETKCHKVYTVALCSNLSNLNTLREFEFLGQDIICGEIPRTPKGAWLNELKGSRIWLSDLGRDSPKIELLIGSDIYGSLLSGRVKQLENGLTAIETHLGWTICGPSPKKDEQTDCSSLVVISMHSRNMSVDYLWNLETIGIKDPRENLTKLEEDKLVHQHFLNTVHQQEDGRFCVGLPWLGNQEGIPSNRHIVERRLFNTTRKLRAKCIFSEYDRVFQEWLAEGVIEKVSPEDLNRNCHYLPHHPVVKANSNTTKIRPVFDASCKDKGNLSLNDCLASGPNVIEQIPAILLKFREKAIGVIADIRKAFLQIEVKEEDRDYLRFLWWKNNHQIQVFRHKRVVFGVTCSPHLLGAVILHHLKGVSSEFGALPQKLMECLYIDNCVTSVDTEAELVDLVEKSTEIFAKAKMDLRMWQFGPIHRVKEVYSRLPPSVDIERSEEASVLGMKWNLLEDTLNVTPKFGVIINSLSKRDLLSHTQQIFDPIGFLAPVLLPAKLLIQQAWTVKTDWDELLPSTIQENFMKWYKTFDFSTPNEWPKWRKRFERYLVVSGMKKKEEADKIDLFMYLMGDRADDIFRTFKFEKEEEATKIDSVLKAFDSHFCVRKNIIYERAKFNSRIQEDREPVDEFITSLYKLADSCEFEGLHEQLIRDRIVVGVRDKALSERMQLDSELTLEKAVKMVRQQEAVRQQQVDLQRPSTSQKVSQVKFNSKKQSPKQQQQPSRKKEKSAKTRSRCPKCGGFTHREGQACRAEGQKCNLCSKTGHFANCFPDKPAKTAEVKAVSELDEEIGFLLEVSATEDSSNLDDDEGECRRRWTAEIQVNGKQLKFKLHSQADVTCVPLCLFKKIMGQQRLVESDINIRAAEFSELQTVGMFISTLRNGNYEIKEKIYVIRRLSEPLLSRRACELLNLARRIEVVATRINPIKEFPEVFEGLGQIGNPYEIKLKPGAKPYAVHTPRRVPIPLMEKLKTRLKELDNRRQDDILTNIFEAQQEDTTLKAVVNYLEQGWPDKKNMSQALLSYWHVKDELGVQNGLLMRSCRLVIPASMKLEILDKLHAGHFGITKTRLRARETVWWPGISEEIAETVRKCSVCIQEAVSKHEPLIPTNFPTRPWQKIGMDLFKFENKWYLVVIDYYSRFPEVVQLDRLTANVVVRSCKSIFARHGIPETVVSDNGTQFGAAREFANFARQYGFTHVTSSPRFPQSNGMAEAGVKIAKLILKKNQDPSLGLLEYRSTPLENGYSPAELLMGRELRKTLPIAPENLNPKLVDSQTLKRKEGRRRKDMKSRYDRRCGATDMEELSEGDTVWITDMRTWGIVKQKASTPRSYMVDTPVGTLRRNRFHLRKGVTVQYPADPSTPTFSGEELVENEKTPVVDYPSNDSEDGQIRTRSGRIVKPVDRLHY